MNIWTYLNDSKNQLPPKDSFYSRILETPPTLWSWSTHNYNAPGLSWQVALKMTDVELDLLTDTDKHLFIEEGIRAGVAKINHRYARANTLGKENYDTSKRNSYIMYLDANNLYGWAM